MILHNIIMHRIDKEQHKTDASISYREDVLNQSEPIILNFVNSIVHSYYKKTSRQYSKFSTEGTPPFKIHLDRLLSNITTEEFIDFSIEATVLLKDHMCAQAASSGGYLVIADYELDNRFMMVVLMKQKTGFEVRDGLDIGTIKELDIDQFAMAGFINLSIYQQNNNERQYLSFMRGERDVSGYFTSFLGSAKESTESTAQITAKLVHAIQEYMTENDYEQDKSEEAVRRVVQYCENQKKEHLSIELNAIANLIDYENPNSFFLYAQEREINAVIEGIHSPSLKKLQDFQYKTKSFAIRFHKNLINTETVRLDGNRLIIAVDDQFIQTWVAEGMGETNE